MNYELKISNKLKQYITKREIIDNGIIDGVRYRLDFENGLVASVVKLITCCGGKCDLKFSVSDGGSRDLWECAVLQKNNNLASCDITGDNCVLGYMTDKDVELFLECVRSGNIDTDFKIIKAAAKKYFKKKGE